MILEKSILLLKTQKADDSSDKYENLLTESGFDVKQGKTLVFNFKNLECLQEKLSNHTSYEGIIFSSPRCVQATYMAVTNTKHVIKLWQSKANFVVGEATYADALKKLHLECRGKETGNSVNLSQYILEGKNQYTKPFLFPHGNLKTDTLSRELGQYGISMEGVLVYDTMSNPNIEQDIAELTDNFQNIPEYIVFFSPSGLNSSLKILQKIHDFENVKLIAIGPTTELAMREQNLKIFGVAKNPTANDVLNLILSH